MRLKRRAPVSNPPMMRGGAREADGDNTLSVKNNDYTRSYLGIRIERSEKKRPMKTIDEQKHVLSPRHFELLCHLIDGTEASLPYSPSRLRAYKADVQRELRQAILMKE